MQCRGAQPLTAAAEPAGDGGDSEEEEHGLPAGLLRRLCRGLFLRLRRTIWIRSSVEVWCSSHNFLTS
jgi:hypothetical protein